MSASVTDAPRTVSPGPASAVGRSVFGRLRSRVRWGIKVEGIANLRGELVTLINPWRLYGLPEPENIDQKVVIIVHEGVKYGMLVESVDQIIMVTDREVLPLPPLANGNESRKVAQDVSASIHLTAGIDAEDAMMIIDTSSLVSRCLSTAA